MNPGILTPSTQYATMPRGLLGRPTPVPLIDARRVFDPDAERYIAAVEQADGRPLEEAVRVAIGEFVIGCKADGIWSAMRASCILMGARTLAGALTPLVGSSPTNNNFVTADYNRRTGLVGNNATKWLNSNRPNNADPQDSKHIAAFSTNTGWVETTIGSAVATGASYIFSVAGLTDSRLNSSNNRILTGGGFSGLMGASRNSSASYVMRANRSNTTYSEASAAPSADTIGVFARSGLTRFSNVRLCFYSIGTAVDLALLDSRVTALFNEIGAGVL